MGMWDEHAKRIRMVLGPALNKTDKWGRLIPGEAGEDEVPLPPSAEELFPRPRPHGEQSWSRMMWPELGAETPEEAYRNDMIRRQAVVERMRDDVARGRVAPKTPALPSFSPPLALPEMSGAAMFRRARAPVDVYQTFPRMPRTPISRGSKTALDDDGIAAIAFNETASFTGDDIDRARKTILHAVINGSEAGGAMRPKTADAFLGRSLSPTERKR